MINNQLDSLRRQIDSLDKQILQLLGKRMDVVRKVGKHKLDHGIPPLDEKRWQHVLESKLLLAQKLGLDQDMVKDIYERIHKAALKSESAVQKGTKT